MRLIDANALMDKLLNHYQVRNPAQNATMDECCMMVFRAPTVDAVELPKGKPGDCLEWNNGAGFTRMYYIHSVMICEDCIRYDLDAFAPVISHPCIVRILTREEAEAAIAERKDYGE